MEPWTDRGGRVVDWTPICEADRVCEGKALGVEIDGHRLAVFNDGGRFHVLAARCPHSHGPMDRGWIEEHEAVCPLHRWRFRLDTGRCTSVRGYELYRFPTELREGRVWARTGSWRSGPADGEPSEPDDQASP